MTYCSIQFELSQQTVRTFIASKNYFKNDAPLFGIIWRASLSGRNEESKDVRLTHQGMFARAITKRVKILGETV